MIQESPYRADTEMLKKECADLRAQLDKIQSSEAARKRRRPLVTMVGLIGSSMALLVSFSLAVGATPRLAFYLSIMDISTVLLCYFASMLPRKQPIEKKPDGTRLHREY